MSTLTVRQVIPVVRDLVPSSGLVVPHWSPHWSPHWCQALLGTSLVFCRLASSPLVPGTFGDVFGVLSPGIGAIGAWHFWGRLWCSVAWQRRHWCLAPMATLLLNYFALYFTQFFIYERSIQLFGFTHSSKQLLFMFTYR